MNCDGVRGLLSAYVDGELSAGELLRVEQHLRRCHWCADEVDALRQTIALVASLDEVEVPPLFHAQLHERLVALGPSTAQAQHPRRRDFRRWAVPAAAAAVLVIGLTSAQRLLPPAGLDPAAVVEPANQVSAVDQPGVTAPTDSNPVAVQEPGDGIAPPVEEPGSVTQPGDDPTEQVVAVTTPEEPVDSTPPTPIGPVSTRPGVHAASASFLTEITEPTSLPSRKQLNATVEASVAEPVSVAEALKAYFPEGSITEAVDAGGSIVRMQIAVDAGAYSSALSFVEEQTGAKAADGSQELSKQLADAYAELDRLERERLETIKQLAGETDADTLAAADQHLQQLAAQADSYRTAYQRLQEQVARGTITVVLKPATAAE